ncbi:hypothetical protein [Arthrobacter sp. ISL-69]|uniref:hypothetical protein n=1 Tax=Arthrobacter sp. ISL-69 TaxID=2819113 RepID=UPI001BE63A83|nr:hypothetical protein [Arthrobacter sp. ISL-69]MBT2538675.1 hypothetical protein [Arthrobacter sp. ISL-69]
MNDDELEELEAGRQMSADPFQIARMFFTAMHWHPESAGEFQFLMTPESLAAEGRVDMAAALFRTIERPGISQKVAYAPGKPHIAYVGVHRGVNTGYVPKGTRLEDPLYITLVWRPDCGGWVVHAFGDRIPAEAVPRSA